MQEKPVQHVYVITRLDIPQPHRSVQVAHAAMASVHSFGMPARHPNLVVCGVANESVLTELFNDLKERGIPCLGWHEDDMNDELTAIATAALPKSQRKVFRGLRLLKE